MSTDNLDLDPAFLHVSYTLRRSVFTLFGAEFKVLDPQDNLALFTRQKAFRLREKFTMYADQQKTRPLLEIDAKQMIDFAATYMVKDMSRNGEVVGGMRRKGWKSGWVRDEWEILDAAEQPIGKLVEDGNALLRRYIPLGNLVPQTFHLELDGHNVATFKQRFNPFIYKLEMDFSADMDSRLDPRLSLSAGILIAAIEGRQQN